MEEIDMTQLHDKLTTTIASVNAYAVALDGSHAALYQVLAHACDLYLTAKQSPDAFVALATEAGVRVTGQASEPLALLVIKLVFHNLSDFKYDHRRKHGNWSLVLAHLDEAGVPVEMAETYLANGGVDHCVKQYHAARKASVPTAKTAAATPSVANDEFTASPSADIMEISPAPKGSARKVLLLGEIAEDGSITVLRVVESDETAVAAFLAANDDEKEAA
ncbi:hypothetical protein [Magnetospira sp. QH-2]|uniref:hypothetical protein n=1 Tax=Magnetospira sp. (strain QH-2) TaxID=1288970 RepID=UPI0003E80AE8|nr:hypothetical protein [Magnetospira sp. QH-2]CCQ72779.1 protein of unknown function [Magnetospira sp. QH-2]